MPLRTGTPLPALSGATEWINGAPPPRETLRGGPLLVHFWAVSCHLCHDNMPTVVRWRDEFASQGLRVIAIHMPRQEADLDVARVRDAAAAMGITEPCGIDNTHAVADAFDNRFVPAYFLFDREGHLRSRTAGDAGLALLDAALRRQFPVVPADR
ncbi:MAG: TlpA disulfide reductase family protein [Candidatus Rokuibacteriota bacterium]